MNLKENKQLAWILVIIAMLTSVMISGSISLSTQRRAVLNTFYDTMNDDLNTKSFYADNLVGIASRYIDQNSEYIVNMTQARDLLAKANTPKEKYMASLSITNAASAIYDLLGTKDLTQTDDRLRRSNYADILAVDDILKRSGFNTQVEAFNEQLSKFPASLISSIVRIEKAEYFR